MHIICNIKTCKMVFIRTNKPKVYHFNRNILYHKYGCQVLLFKYQYYLRVNERTYI